MIDAANPLRPTAEAALAAWAALVDADAEQVPRVREPEPPADHYGTTAAHFRPGGLDAHEWPLIEALARAEDTWLDIGAGGGRFAVPLARRVARVVAIEPSPAMRATLEGAAADAALANIDVHDARWPSVPPQSAWGLDADVALAAHVIYDIRAIGPFLDAMERHARRLCVIVVAEQGRGANVAPLFEAVHGEPQRTLPALREVVALLGALGRPCEVRLARREGVEPVLEREEAYEVARRLLWLRPGSPKDARMRALMEEWWGTAEGIALPGARRVVGVVSWRPGGGIPQGPI